MKTYRSNIFVLFFSLLGLSSTTKKFQPNMEIKIGHHIFNANLNSNSSALKFKALLPLNLNMIELNGNEKYASLPISLPVNHEKVNKIKAGDIMLYGDAILA